MTSFFLQTTYVNVMMDINLLEMSALISMNVQLDFGPRPFHLKVSFCFRFVVHVGGTVLWTLILLFDFPSVFFHFNKRKERFSFVSALQKIIFQKNNFFLENEGQTDANRKIEQDMMEHTNRSGKLNSEEKNSFVHKWRPVLLPPLIR